MFKWVLVVLFVLGFWLVADALWPDMEGQLRWGIRLLGGVGGWCVMRIEELRG